MVTTRSGVKGVEKTAGSVKANSTKKRASNVNNGPAKKVKTEHSALHSKATKHTSKEKKGQTTRVQELANRQGNIPLQSNHLKAPQEATPETVLAHLLNALVSSARISHTIAAQTLEKLLAAKYHEMGVIQQSSWHERTVVLTESGYTRYREKTATSLGQLADHLEEAYGGDASQLIAVQESDGDAKKIVAKRVKEFKQIGELGAEIFLETIQAVAPHLAPSISKRNLEVVEKMGLCNDTETLFNELGRDSTVMSKFCQAITIKRLEGKVAGR
jgi:hypothetical protein